MEGLEGESFNRIVNGGPKVPGRKLVKTFPMSPDEEGIATPVGVAPGATETRTFTTAACGEGARRSEENDEVWIP